MVNSQVQIGLVFQIYKWLSSAAMLSYRKHKLNIKLEPYLLQVRNKKHRRMLAKLRLSDHKLEIETGRHQRPKIDQDKRICRLCNILEVENKIHFLMQCNLYKQFTRLRKDFHSSLNFIDKQSAECNVHEKPR